MHRQDGTAEAGDGVMEQEEEGRLDTEQCIVLSVDESPAADVH